MKKITLALMFVFVCCSLGLAQKGRQATAQEKKDLNFAQTAAKQNAELEAAMKKIYQFG